MHRPSSAIGGTSSLKLSSNLAVLTFLCNQKSTKGSNLKITREDVLRVADLAYLELSESKPSNRPFLSYN